MSKAFVDKKVGTNIELPPNYNGQLIQLSSTANNATYMIGDNNVNVNISPTKDLLRELKDNNGMMTFDVPGKTLIVISYQTGVAEEGVKTRWTLKIKTAFSDLKREILTRITDGIEQGVIEAILEKYETFLVAVVGSSLAFEFWHKTRDSADHMIRYQDDVKHIFMKMFQQMTDGEIRFEMKIERLPGMHFLPVFSDFKEKHSQSLGSDQSDLQTETVKHLNQLEQSLSDFKYSYDRDIREIRETVSQVRDVVGNISQAQVVPKKPQRSALAQSVLKEPKTKSEEVETFMQSLFQAWLGVLMPSGLILPTSQKGGLTPSIPQTAVVAHASVDPTVRVPVKPGLDVAGISDTSPGHPLKSSELELKASGARSVSPGASGMTSQSMDHQETEALVPEVKVLTSESTVWTTSEAIIIAGNSDRAELLMSSLNVCSPDQGKRDPRVRNLIASVALALEKDDPHPPKATGQDTVLCIDVSGSMGQNGFNEVKRCAHEFIDALEDTAENFGLEENVALVVMGGRARVVKQLTNDYGALREALDSINFGGRSPLFEAILVCVGAIKEKGGTLSIGGVYELKPRIIFMTDGWVTDDDVHQGLDQTLADPNIRVQVIRLIQAVGSRSRVSYNTAWVPIGNADTVFLTSLAKLSDGVVADSTDIAQLAKYYRIQQCIGNIYKLMKDEKQQTDEETFDTLVSGLTSQMDEKDREIVKKGVEENLRHPEFIDVPQPDVKSEDFDNVFESRELLPLGTRVRRGPDWHDDNQDCDGPGTVVNHSKTGHWLWVRWDLSNEVHRYKYDSQGPKEVKEVEDEPRFLNQKEMIEIGVRVKRGLDWHHGEEDGGVGNTGVVIRERQDGVVKVRWQATEFIGTYNYGRDGKLDIAICELEDFMKISDPKEQQEKKEPSTTVKRKTEDYEIATPEKPNVVWQWKDELGQWLLYKEDQLNKLNAEFHRRPQGSCLVQKGSESVRVFFKQPMSEKPLSYGGIRHEVKRIAVSDEELQKMKSTSFK